MFPQNEQPQGTNDKRLRLTSYQALMMEFSVNTPVQAHYCTSHNHAVASGGMPRLLAIVPFPSWRLARPSEPRQLLLHASTSTPQVRLRSRCVT